MTTQTQAPINPFAPPGQYGGAYQQPAAPAPVQVPPPNQPYQTLDLGPDRWKSLHGDMKSNAVAIAALVGTRFPQSDEEQNDGALSNQDMMLNEDGSSDMDFEESQIEILGKIMTRAKEIDDTAERFRY